MSIDLQSQAQKLPPLLLGFELEPFAFAQQIIELQQFAAHCSTISPDDVLETFSHLDPRYDGAKQRLLAAGL